MCLNVIHPQHRPFRLHSWFLENTCTAQTCVHRVVTADLLDRKSFLISSFFCLFHLVLAELFTALRGLSKWGIFQLVSFCAAERAFGPRPQGVRVWVWVCIFQDEKYTRFAGTNCPCHYASISIVVGNIWPLLGWDKHQCVPSLCLWDKASAKEDRQHVQKALNVATWLKRQRESARGIFWRKQQQITSS